MYENSASKIKHVKKVNQTCSQWITSKKRMSKAKDVEDYYGFLIVSDGIVQNWVKDA